MNNIEEHGIYKALYGITPEELKGNIQGNSKREQTAELGGEIWRANGSNVFEFMPVKLGGVDLWSPVVRVVGRKTIIETQLVERRGSVKEIISIDDYIINIKGVIKRKDGLWPDEELGKLVELYERNEAVKIESAKTNRILNGLEYVVITNLQLPDTPGFVESIRYEIECVVDIPFELELDEDGN